ncbi:MAG: TonB family protein, partial [Mariprofundaceae bacterium]|nr:TonB family protein [Mariprofundaceae bacterium]
RLIEVALVQQMPPVAQEVSLKEPSPDIAKPQPKMQEKSVIPPKKTKRIKKKRPTPKVVKKLVPQTVKKKVKAKVIKKSVDVPKAIASSRSATTSNDVVKLHMPAHTQASLKALKQQYLSHVLLWIQSHKYYPYSARRRHIEGDVQVSFMVDKAGKISELHITGGASVLRASTRQAIEDSLPLPLPAKALSSTYSHFTMVYRLK